MLNHILSTRRFLNIISHFFGSPSGETKYHTISELKNLSKIQFYNPKYRVWVVVLASLIVFVALITPFTNAVLFPIALKIWRYR